MFFLEGACGDLEPLVKLLHSVFRLFQFAIPILLILFGCIDLGKAVIAGKEDEQKKAQSLLIKRLIYAILVFFIFTIVTLVMNLVTSNAEDAEGDGTYDWKNCWNET